MSFATVPEAVEEIRAGRMLVVVDDEDRENEGDLTLAAEKVTSELINFMARYGRGLICLALTEERLEHLRVPLMTQQNMERMRCASKPAELEVVSPDSSSAACAASSDADGAPSMTNAPSAGTIAET